MNCNKCNKEISNDSIFCVHCGAKVSKPIIKEDKNKNKNGTRSFLSQLAYVVVFLLAMGVAKYAVKEIFFSSTPEVQKESSYQVNKIDNKNDGSFNWDTDTTSLEDASVKNVIATEDAAPSQEYIDEVVAETKKGLTIPSKLDEVTELANITSEPGAIRYHYILSGVDSSQFSNDSLKKYLVSSVCKTAETKDVINHNIKMEYSYILDGMPKYFVSISKGDCLK